MRNADEIKTKADFISVIPDLSKNYREHPESWENADIGTYLAALAAWVEDMEGFYLNQKLPIPQKVDWKILADMLIAAKSYE